MDSMINSRIELFIQIFFTIAVNWSNSCVQLHSSPFSQRPLYQWPLCWPQTFSHQTGVPALTLNTPVHLNSMRRGFIRGTRQSETPISLGLQSRATLSSAQLRNYPYIAKIKSEPVFDAVSGTNQIFKGVGSYLDVLQAQYDFESFSVWDCKIHPNFVRAWDVTPGLHGTDLAESYDLHYRLGGGASYGFDAAGLANKLQLSAFTVDRTIFSGSLFNDRGRTSLIDGALVTPKAFLRLLQHLMDVREVKSIVAMMMEVLAISLPRATRKMVQAAMAMNLDS